MVKVWALVLGTGLAVPLAATAPGVAQFATPVIEPFVLDEAACTVPPRPVEELATVAASPFPETSVRAAATVAAILGEDWADFATPTGTAADPAMIDSVAATIGEFYACLATGNDLAAAGLATDDWLRSQIVVGAGASDDRGDASSAAPVPDLVAGSRARISGVQALEDRRVKAVVDIDLPSGASRVDYVLLREQDGRYLVEGSVAGVPDDATPAP